MITLASQLLEKTVSSNASDVFIVAGLPVSMRLNGIIVHEDEERLKPNDTAEIIKQIYQMANERDMQTLLATGDDDFSFSIPGLSRFRVSAFKQRGSLSAVIRVISFSLPDAKEQGIPQQVIDFADFSKGLVLVTGPAGSGKSTTLACVIDHINQTRHEHIITLEDPLEFLHRHNKSIVSQREISVDTVSYVTALRASLRQSPDVILLGEMRDFETIQVAMTAAETGHLIFQLYIRSVPPIRSTVSSMYSHRTSNDRLQSSYPWFCRLLYHSSLSLLLTDTKFRHLKL